MSKLPGKALVFLISWSAVLFLPETGRTQGVLLRATPSSLVIRSPEGVQKYKIEATAQQVISLEIKQNGTDVRVKLSDRRGRVVAESDVPFSEQDVERIFVVANDDGPFQVELEFKFTGRGGSVVVSLFEMKIASPADLMRMEAERLLSQAQSLRVTGRTADQIKAREIYERSLTIWQGIGDQIGELRALAALSYLNRRQGRNEISKKFADLILQAPNLPENAEYRSDALYQLAQLYSGRGENTAAIETFQQALRQFAEPSPKQANIYATLGNLYQSIDEFELAETALNEASGNVERFPDIYNEAQLRHVLGFFYFSSRNYESALENFRAAAALRGKVGNRRGQAISLRFQAITYYDLRDLQRSIEILERILPVSRELGDRDEQSDVLVNLGRAYRDVGRVADAIDAFQKADALWKDTSGQYSLYLTWGATYLETGNYAQARILLQRALAACRKIGDIEAEARTLYQLAKLERSENKLDDARIRIEQALQIHEYAQAKYKNIRLLSNFLETRRRAFDLYVDILMLLDQARPNENFAVKALQVSEGARMRTLIWQLREAARANPQTADSGMFSEMQNVQQQIGEQLAMLAKSQSRPDNTDRTRTIEASIGDLNQQYEKLKARLRLANPNFASFANPPTLSLSEMQAELDEETVLVEYSLGEQRSYLWVVGKHSFESFVLPKRAEIDGQARIVYEILSDDPSAAVARPKNRTAKKPISEKALAYESDKLSHLLAFDKFANLAAKRLLFVPDGALNLIPFASLSFSRSNTVRFLGEKYETVQLPSLTTLNIVRQTRKEAFAPHSLAVIADPVFSQHDERVTGLRTGKISRISDEKDLAATLRDFNLTSISRLPFSRIEAERIAQNSLPNTSLNLGFRASRTRLLKGEFDNFDILHFATHGFLNNQHPELSGVVLSLVDKNGDPQNGFLRTQDLYLLKIKPQMVVLSACQTGLGKQVENEGLVGLTRGFLANGTPRVVASLWKVEDTATAELMSRFYRAMFKENQPPSTALRTAQNQLRQIPRFSHPRYWAGFTLTGEWR